MTIKFLLDTNVVSEPLRPRPSAGLMRRLRSHEGEMAIPVLVWHELRFGYARLARSRRRAAIERYLDDERQYVEEDIAHVEQHSPFNINTDLKELREVDVSS